MLSIRKPDQYGWFIDLPIPSYTENNHSVVSPLLVVTMLSLVIVSTFANEAQFFSKINFSQFPVGILLSNCIFVSLNGGVSKQMCIQQEQDELQLIVKQEFVNEVPLLLQTAVNDTGSASAFSETGISPLKASNIPRKCICIQKKAALKPNRVPGMYSCVFYEIYYQRRK